jgi:hypothetical protein
MLWLLIFMEGIYIWGYLYIFSAQERVQEEYIMQKWKWFVHRLFNVETSTISASRANAGSISDSDRITWIATPRSD